MSQAAAEDDEALQEEEEEEEEEAAEQEDDPLANLLSLKLKKPPHWNWELSTSRSCSNIALPRILLYDHTGNLLVDADGQKEEIYTSRDSQRRRKRSATANLERNFHGLRIAEATPTPTPTVTPSEATPSSSRESGRRKTHGSCIDFSTHELPNWEPSVSSRRSSSLRAVRFQETEDLPVYPTPPSTSTLNSSSSGPREKRRYRRSQSSILERFSLSKGRHSSPEFAQEEDVVKAPRYYLRTSKAGTLVIREESFSSQKMRHRRRRPPKHSSSENILQEQEKEPPATSVVQATTRRRAQERTLSTSEEDVRNAAQETRRSRGRPRNTSQRSCGKDAAQELITVDPDNCVYRAAPGATAR
uniref:CG15247-PA n=1 Tax=Drosophila melanogaster TaxID=7227 RepID=C0MLU4_DROME|nr:CG15247-PA [Drosophila melanogaster]